MLPLPSLSSTEASESTRHRANRYARYQAVKELQAQGVSLHGIARTLVMSPNTVRRYVRASTFPERARYRLGSRLEAYLPYLHARWVQGVHNPTVLWQEIRAQGYPGTARMIDYYIVRLYQRLKGLTPQQRARFLQTALTFKAPTVRHLVVVQLEKRRRERMGRDVSLRQPVLFPRPGEFVREGNKVPRHQIALS